MSALKTVERAGELKTFERKLEILARDISAFTNRQNDVNREIRKVEQNLSLLNNLQKTEDTIGGKSALTGERLEKFNKLDKHREFLTESRGVLEGDIAKLTSESNNNSTALSELETKLDNVNKEIKSIEKQVGELICEEKLSRQNEIEILTQTHNGLLEKRDILDSKISESTAQLNEVKGKIADIKKANLKSNPLGKGLKKLGGVGIGTVTNAAKGGAKSGFNKVDPLSKGINKNDVGDTGTESIRLARQTVDKTIKGIKTTKNTVKTTARGIKTVKNATVATAKATYKMTAATVKMAYVTAKMIVTGTTHLIAALFNPIVLIVIGVLLVVVMLAQLVILLMGAGLGVGAMVTATGAGGLGDVPASYSQGLTLLNNASLNAQTGFNELVNAPVYLGNDQYNGDLANSDLVFLRVTNSDEGITDYSTAFATNWQKAMLRNAWNFSLPENDILAIAYVLLQKRANEANGTVGQVYSVVYTEEVFEEIIELMVSYSTTLIHNQPCPEQNCTIEIYYVPNPAYTALEQQIESIQSQLEYWWEQLGIVNEQINSLWEQIYDLEEQIAELDPDDPQIPSLNMMLSTRYILIDVQYSLYNSYVGIYNIYVEQYNQRYVELVNTPPELEMETEPFCDSLHTNHSIGLRYFTTENAMTALAFTDTERQLVTLTILGFENNPNLS